MMLQDSRLKNRSYKNLRNTEADTLSLADRIPYESSTVVVDQTETSQDKHERPNRSSVRNEVIGDGDSDLSPTKNPDSASTISPEAIMAMPKAQARKKKKSSPTPYATVDNSAVEKEQHQIDVDTLPAAETEVGAVCESLKRTEGEDRHAETQSTPQQKSHAHSTTSVQKLPSSRKRYPKSFSTGSPAMEFAIQQAQQPVLPGSAAADLQDNTKSGIISLTSEPDTRVRLITPDAALLMRSSDVSLTPPISEGTTQAVRRYASIKQGVL